MFEQKGNLGILIVVFAAFIWGYKKEGIQASVRELKFPWSESAPEVAPAPILEKTAEAPAPPVAKSPGAATDIPSASIPSPFVTSKPSEQPRTQGNYNPYRELMQKAQQQRKANKPAAGFSNTMDSIQGGKIEQAQKTRRNAYFEKLSQQLKELRGEEPKKEEPEKDMADALGVQAPAAEGVGALLDEASEEELILNDPEMLENVDELPLDEIGEDVDGDLAVDPLPLE